MSPRPFFPEAQDLEFTPHLSAEELRRVYRRLARKYHPDAGIDGSAEIMSHINALHDEIKKQIETSRRARQPSESRDDPPRQQPLRMRPAKARETPLASAAKNSRREQDQPTQHPQEECLGALLMTEEARGLMSEALIEAVDAWLVCNRGVPRNALRRRMMVRMGRIGPVSCPGLHMPQSVSMSRRALRFHFRSSPVEGLNLVALPRLSNNGVSLTPSGRVSVLEECFQTGQASFTIPHFQASSLGFILEFDGHALPIELLFAGAKEVHDVGPYRLPHRRFQGLFTPATLRF